MVCKPFSCEFPCGSGQVRYMVAFMCTIGILLAYVHRSVFNIAIVEMVTIKKHQAPSTCPGPVGQGNSTISNIGGGKVDWSEKQQQILIAGFFPLYFLIHIPAGLACDRWGARHFMMWSQGISSFFTALSPLVAVSFPWWVTFILRLLIGAAQGIQFPAVSALISRWIPATERSTVGAIAFGANSFGIVIGNLGTGMMIRSFEDWRIPYYVWGGVGFLYCLVFIAYVFSDPRMSPYITPSELEYLTESIDMKKKMNVPFKKVFSDLCVWGMLAAQVGNGFVIFMLANNMPKYLNNVLGFEVTWNAVISLIFLLQWLGGIALGSMSDYLIKKKNANISWVRKILTAVSNITSALFLVAVNLIECNHTLAIIFFANSAFFKGIYFASMKVNIIDISVNHSALMMSVVNGLAAFTGFLGPYMISVIVPNNAHSEWRIYFLILVAIEVVTTILYFTLSSSERRVWDYPPGEEPPPKKKAAHWWLQMTPSDNEIRLEKNKKSEEHRKAAAKEAKEKAKEASLTAKETKKA